MKNTSRFAFVCRVLFCVVLILLPTQLWAAKSPKPGKYKAKVKGTTIIVNVGKNKRISYVWIKGAHDGWMDVTRYFSEGTMQGNLRTTASGSWEQRNGSPLNRWGWTTQECSFTAKFRKGAYTGRFHWEYGQYVPGVGVHANKGSGRFTTKTRK